MNGGMRGIVVASHQAAADAGTEVLRSGGNAIDAAVAAAATLVVADPANCGVAGFGGFMVVDQPSGHGAMRVDFNTAVPAQFEPALLRQAGHAGPFVHGGPSVSIPAVVPGLATAHRAFGRLPFSDLFEPAVTLAGDGLAVGSDLGRSLAWVAKQHGGLSREFKAVFFRNDQPLRAGDRLVQPELAASLEYIARHGEEAWRSGPLVEAICDCVSAEGGALSPADFARAAADVAEAERTSFDDAVVYGPTRLGSGYDILSQSLSRLQDRDFGGNRGVDYAHEIAAALRAAWDGRRARWSLLIAESQHTNHFCTADAEGMLVSCTFTHGPLWFGSGLVVPGTGMVLNCGANLFARQRTDGSFFPLTNLTPVIVACADGSRHAIGSPGGIRIPAVVLQSVLDLVRYKIPLPEALPLPRVSVDFDGNLEAEPPLAQRLHGAKPIRVSDYYGPASGISLAPEGPSVAARDPRFTSAWGAA